MALAAPGGRGLVRRWRAKLSPGPVSGRARPVVSAHRGLPWDMPAPAGPARSARAPVRPQARPHPVAAAREVVLRDQLLPEAPGREGPVAGVEPRQHHRHLAEVGAPRLRGPWTSAIFISLSPRDRSVRHTRTLPLSEERRSRTDRMLRGPVIPGVTDSRGNPALVLQSSCEQARHVARKPNGESRLDRASDEAYRPRHREPRTPAGRA